MARRLFYSLTISLIFFLVVYKLCNNDKVYNPVLSKKTSIPKEVKVSAKVRGHILEEISGWTSPFAEVTLSSPGLMRKTIADTEGFFIFYSVSVPENLAELSLISQDVNQIGSCPLFLPVSPKEKGLKIINILLPPSLSLESGEIIAHKTAKASGMTFPNSSVQVYLFTEKRDYTLYNFYKLYKRYNIFSPTSVYAYSLPILEIQSNANGYFEFSLPASFSSNNRIFATSLLPPNKGPDLLSKRSPKSFTLNLLVLGFWDLLKNLFHQLSLFFRNSYRLFCTDIFCLILIEIIILIAILGAFFVRRTGKKLLQSSCTTGRSLLPSGER